MTDNDRAAFEAVNVGDIFVSSWGWEQTNIDFYKVVAKTKARIKVVAIGKDRVSGDGWTGRVVPVPEREGTKVMVKTVTAGYDGEGAWFTVSSYAAARLWDGTAKNETGYA